MKAKKHFSLNYHHPAGQVWPIHLEEGETHKTRGARGHGAAQPLVAPSLPPSGLQGTQDLQSPMLGS